MKIIVNPYIRRDGRKMVYLNNDRGVSLGISPETGYQSSKASKGQQKLWHAFCQAVRETATVAPVATGADMSAHGEWAFTMFNGISFAETDVATIGGVAVPEDGLYLVTENGAVVRRRLEIEE